MILIFLGLYVFADKYVPFWLGKWKHIILVGLSFNKQKQNIDMQNTCSDLRMWHAFAV